MAYATAVGNGWVSRSDFWSMPPGEFWWLVAAKIPDFETRQPDNVGTLRAMVKSAKAREKHG